MELGVLFSGLFDTAARLSIILWRVVIGFSSFVQGAIGLGIQLLTILPIVTTVCVWVAGGEEWRRDCARD